jgi:hypothetical protein
MILYVSETLSSSLKEEDRLRVSGDRVQVLMGELDGMEQLLR